MNFDVETLLKPVSKDKPGGEDVEYELIYDEIRQARESDPDYLPLDEWKTELRKADWDKVVRLSSDVLSQLSKDLQVSCWLTEGLCQKQGLAGLEQGLRVLDGLLTGFWDTLWPAADEDGLSIRHGILGRLDRALVTSLTFYPFLEEPDSTLDRYRQHVSSGALMQATPEENDSQGMTFAEYERWASSVSSETLCQCLREIETVKLLLSGIESRYSQCNPQAPDGALSRTSGLIDETEEFIHWIVKMSGIAESTLSDKQQIPSENTPSAPECRQELNRVAALNQITDIARFFRKTEPSSPVPFLLERAVRWADMTLTEWLQEMLTDDSSLQGIHKVLTGPEQE